MHSINPEQCSKNFIQGMEKIKFNKFYSNRYYGCQDLSNLMNSKLCAIEK